MTNGILGDDSRQCFYSPHEHPRAGVFKGMAVILEASVGLQTCRLSAKISSARKVPLLAVVTRSFTTSPILSTSDQILRSDVKCMASRSYFSQSSTAK